MSCYVLGYLVCSTSYGSTRYPKVWIQQGGRNWFAPDTRSQAIIPSAFKISPRPGDNVGKRYGGNFFLDFYATYGRNFHFHSNNQKDRGGTTFLKTYLWDGPYYQRRFSLPQDVPWAHGSCSSRACPVWGTCNAHWRFCAIWSPQDCLCSGSGRSGMCPHLSCWLEAALGTFVLLVSVWTPDSLRQSSLTSLACNAISIREEKSGCSS